MLFNPGSVFLTHKGEAGRLLSPRAWCEAKGQNLAPDGSLRGYYIEEDFRCFGASAAVSSNVGRYGGDLAQYRSYEDTGDSIAQIATDRFGAVSITTTTTDNNESWLQPGAAGSVMGVISTTAGHNKTLVFEARVKFAQVTNTYNAFFGMTEEALAAADTITDAGALASKDAIGFLVTEDDGDALKFVYRKAGQAMQTVFTYSTALAADTWYNLAFVYNPAFLPSKRIKVFINNVEYPTGISAALIADTTLFPNGEELQPLFGIKNQTNVGKTITLDGWAFYQED